MRLREERSLSLSSSLMLSSKLRGEQAPSPSMGKPPISLSTFWPLWELGVCQRWSRGQSGCRHWRRSCGRTGRNSSASSQSRATSLLTSLPRFQLSLNHIGWVPVSRCTMQSPWSWQKVLPQNLTMMGNLLLLLRKAKGDFQNFGVHLNINFPSHQPEMPCRTSASLITSRYWSNSSIT